MTDKEETTNIKKKESVKNEQNKGNINFEKLKNISFSKSFIASIFLLVGIGGTLLTQSFIHKIDNDSNHFSEKASRQKEANQWIRYFYDRDDNGSDRFFSDFYSNSFNIFSDIEDFHEITRERFFNFDKYFENYFNNFKEQNYLESNVASISQKEDERYILYQVDFKGFNKDDISLKIEGRILNFYAKKFKNYKQDNDNSKSRSRMESNFLYSFLIPKNAKLDNPKIIKEENKITVKFNKI